MHIAMYSPAWPMGANANGIITYVSHMRTAYIAQGHRVSIFTNNIAPGNADDNVWTIPYAPTLMQRLSSKLTKGKFGRLGWGHFIGRRINEIHAVDPIDVVEIEESFGWCADVKSVTGLPIVVKLHGPACLDQEASEPKIKAEAQALKKLQYIVSPSRKTLQTTLQHYDLQPAFVATIPNPMPPAANADHWRLENCDTKTLIFVGRFDWTKGGDIVIKAFHQILQRDPALNLIFVGPDSGIVSHDSRLVHIDDFVSNLFTPKGRTNINYLGLLGRSEIPALRRRAMITLAPSRRDNQPNAVLEAIVQGCPTVAVDAGGISETIEHEVTGLLARPDDLDDFCLNIRRLLDNPDYAARLGRQARAVAQARHAPQTVAEQTIEIYRQAIAHKA